jgi:hypothetical protein
MELRSARSNGRSPDSAYAIDLVDEVATSDLS